MDSVLDLSEEIRSDYLVTKNTKKIWVCLLNMLAVVDEICTRHNIPYYAIGGTLLGAVRHQGFIPWDDDLDIGMLRADYNRFLEAAEKEIGGRYFFQTTLTDKNYYKEHARIRDSETTGICESYALHGCNNGIYLDIIPLENYSDTFFGKVHSCIVRTIGRVMYVKVHHDTRPRNSVKSHIVYLLSAPFDVKRMHRLRERLETRVSRKPTPYVSLGDIYTKAFPKEKLIFKAASFQDKVYLPFEGTKIPAPVGFDDVLKIEYGNYMEFPPVEKRGAHHSIVFDPDTPYEEYIKRHYFSITEEGS